MKMTDTEKEAVRVVNALILRSTKEEAERLISHFDEVAANCKDHSKTK